MVNSKKESLKAQNDPTIHHSPFTIHSSRGLYVHIPFCLKKCHYCNYVISAAPRPEDKEAYLEALEHEIRRARSRYGALAFDTLYLGGGTPSALDPGEMERLFSLVGAAFSLRPGAEVTCEVNPGEADRAKLAAYRRLGVNRLSVGAQSFNDALLRGLGRIHGARAIRETTEWAREIGFENLSLDLIIRLPGQTVGDVEDSARQAVACGARQVVIYDLNVHDETVFGRLRRRGLLELPDEALHSRMHEVAVRVLAGESGFRQYEISSFAKPGYESRHNLVYWHNEEYLGLGPGAFSYMEKRRYQYARTVARYLAKTRAGDASDDEEHFPAPEEIEMETLLTGLRLEEGVALADFPRIRREVGKEVERLVNDGLAASDGRRVRLTPAGRSLAETVFTRLSLEPQSLKIPG